MYCNDYLDDQVMELLDRTEKTMSFDGFEDLFLIKKTESKKMNNFDETKVVEKITCFSAEIWRRFNNIQNRR